MVKKFIILFGLSLMIGLAGLWYGRDLILRFMANLYATPVLGLFVHFDEIKTVPVGGLKFQFEMSGSVEHAPFHGTGEGRLLPLQLERHHLTVIGFPLKALNRRIPHLAGTILAEEKVNLASSGSATIEHLDLRVHCDLNRIQGTVTIRGSLAHPQVLWPTELLRLMIPHEPTHRLFEGFQRGLRKIGR